mmetsp:Transcript_39890/g.123055  ORF Transcript_39890/g.123055 Transcript_39890/m.123055 type:complete len:341 (+) Transcript_39890:251-1273(+)
MKTRSNGSGPTISSPAFMLGNAKSSTRLPSQGPNRPLARSSARDAASGPWLSSGTIPSQYSPVCLISSSSAVSTSSTPTAATRGMRSFPLCASAQSSTFARCRGGSCEAPFAASPWNAAWATRLSPWRSASSPSSREDSRKASKTVDAFRTAAVPSSRAALPTAMPVSSAASSPGTASSSSSAVLVLSAEATRPASGSARATPSSLRRKRHQARPQLSSSGPQSKGGAEQRTRVARAALATHDRASPSCRSHAGKARPGASACSVKLALRCWLGGGTRSPTAPRRGCRQLGLAPPSGPRHWHVGCRARGELPRLCSSRDRCTRGAMAGGGATARGRAGPA